MGGVPVAPSRTHCEAVPPSGRLNSCVFIVSPVLQPSASLSTSSMQMVEVPTVLTGVCPFGYEGDLCRKVHQIDTVGHVLVFVLPLRTLFSKY